MDDIIRYEPESSHIDFKQTEYSKSQYPAFLKDVISMANANIKGSRYIIIGVKTGDTENEILGINSLTDSAQYQNLIHQNIEPEVEITYKGYQIDGKLLGIFEITECNNPPYILKKEFQPLSRGLCYIRKGTTQMPALRADLDRMYAQKSKHGVSANDITVLFTKTGTTSIDYTAVRTKELPSEIIKSVIRTLNVGTHELGTRKALELIPADIQLEFLPHYRYPPLHFPDTLEIAFGNSKLFKKYDDHHLEETAAFLLDFYIENSGTSYVEDSRITVKIPKSSNIRVLKEVTKHPQKDYFLPLMVESKYPNVTEIETGYVITQKLGDIKHKMSNEVFTELPRIAIEPVSIGQTIEIQIEIFGKNLPEAIRKTLKINIT